MVDDLDGFTLSGNDDSGKWASTEYMAQSARQQRWDTSQYFIQPTAAELELNRGLCTSIITLRIARVSLRTVFSSLKVHIFFKEDPWAFFWGFLSSRLQLEGTVLGSDNGKWLLFWFIPWGSLVTSTCYCLTNIPTRFLLPLFLHYTLASIGNDILVL